jgi:regulator of protease activity HflC (stomatin/prohibitin superfamily)
MRNKLEEGGLLLVDFVLRNITFSDEYAVSVEQKQIAEQKAQEAAFVVQQRKQEAEQARQTAQGAADAAVIAAEGEAKAIVIQAQADAEARLIQAQAESEALTLLAAAIKENPDILTLEYIQKLAPGIQVMLVPNDNPFLLPLPSLEGTGTTVVPSPVDVYTDTNP